MDGDGQLVVDEGLFLQATKTLAEREDRFELLNVVHVFTREEYVAASCALKLGREIDDEDRDAIEQYVAAVYLTHSHKAQLEDIGAMEHELPETAFAFVRTAAWSFLTAWTMRYGGLWSEHVVKGTYIDPAATMPPGAPQR